MYSLPSSMLTTSKPSGSLSSSLGTRPLCVHDHTCRWPLVHTSRIVMTSSTRTPTAQVQSSPREQGRKWACTSMGSFWWRYRV